MDYLRAVATSWVAICRLADGRPTPWLSPVGWLRAIRCAGRRQGNVKTTMAAVRMLGALLRDKSLALGLCPCVADEARTFGMANLFSANWYLLAVGQLYEAEDASSMLAYRKHGLAKCWRRASAKPRPSSWTAAATSYSVHSYRCCPSTFTTRCSASNGR